MFHPLVGTIRRGEQKVEVVAVRKITLRVAPIELVSSHVAISPRCSLRLLLPVAHAVRSIVRESRRHSTGSVFTARASGGRYRALSCEQLLSPFHGMLVSHRNALCSVDNSEHVLLQIS